MIEQIFCYEHLIRRAYGFLLLNLHFREKRSFTITYGW